MVKDTDISLGDLADNALLVLFANGSKPAAMELTRRLGPKVFRHAYYRLQNKSDAEDIAQEAFLRLWKIAPDWKKIRHRFQPGFIGLLITCALIGCARDAHPSPLTI